MSKKLYKFVKRKNTLNFYNFIVYLKKNFYLLTKFFDIHKLF